MCKGRWLVGPGGGRPAGPTLHPLAGWFHQHALQEALTRNLKFEVGGSQTRLLPG
jgi:hypothetical protein